MCVNKKSGTYFLEEGSRHKKNTNQKMKGRDGCLRLGENASEGMHRKMSLRTTTTATNINSDVSFQSKNKNFVQRKITFLDPGSPPTRKKMAYRS